MSHTQSDIDQILNDLINEYTGKVIGYYGTYQGECTSPVKYYIERITGQHSPSMGGRADGWTHDFPASFAPYFRYEAYQPGKAYPRGTVLMWGSPHIAIVNHCDGSNTISVFEQNADPDGSPCGVKTRTVNTKTHTCIGAMLPIISVPPAPAPAPKPEVHHYHIQSIDPKQVRIKVDTHKWGLNYDNWAAIKANPQGAITQGTIITVQAILHHDLGGSYYLENPDVPAGYNVVDCEDYVAPAPTPPKVPSAPVPFPTDKTPYQVVKTILGFTTSNNAINHTNATQTVKPGAYMIFNDRYDQWDKTKLLAVNVTKESGKAGTWINVADNVPDRPPEVMAKVAEPIKAVQEAEAAKVPAPAPQVVETEATIRNSFMWLQSSQKPVEFEVTQNFLLTDRVHGGAAINVPAGKIVKVYGTFEQGGRTWALVKRNTDTANYYMYGFPITSRTDFRPTLEDIFDFSERVLYGWELLKDNVSRLIQDVFPSKVKK